jgi:hypothetical protein
MLKHKVEVSSIFHTRLGHFLVVNSIILFSNFHSINLESILLLCMLTASLIKSDVCVFFYVTLFMARKLDGIHSDAAEFCGMSSYSSDWTGGKLSASKSSISLVLEAAPQRPANPGSRFRLWVSVSQHPMSRL